MAVTHATAGGLFRPDGGSCHPLEYQYLYYQLPAAERRRVATLFRKIVIVMFHFVWMEAVRRYIRTLITFSAFVGIFCERVESLRDLITKVLTTSNVKTVHRFFKIKSPFFVDLGHRSKKQRSK